jgi:Ca-activated chloride channel family protein
MFNARLETTKIKAGQPRTLGLLIEAAAPQLPSQTITRSPQAIVFVVDRSGSMGGGRLELIKATIGQMIGQLNPADYISVISFDTEVEINLPLREKATLDAAQLRRELAQLEPRGSTNIEFGYRFGLAEAAKAPSGVETKLILLSDGHANAGITDPVALGQLAALATEHLVSTSTIGIGTGFDETILASVASSGQGNHFAAVAVEEAIAGLQHEIDGLLERSIRNLYFRVEVEPSEHLKSITPIGYVQRFERNSVGLAAHLGELVSGEERGWAFVLDLASFPENELGLVSVRVEITAENALTGEEINYLNTLSFEVAAPQHFVADLIEEDVLAEIAVFKMAGIKEVAAQAARNGSFEEARNLILNAQHDTAELLRQLDKLTPRVRLRILAENRELAELLGFTDIEFAKRATESSFRSARSKPNPRDKN